MIETEKTAPIGFFDSGVGGLSVLARFRKILPSENVIYFGDLIHMPYGNKSKDELVSYARNILSFFKSQNVKSVIIACNTSSAQAYDTIKNEFDFPIYPIIQSCAKVIANSEAKRIGVFATEATVKSGKYTTELKKYNPNIIVKEIANKNWVKIVEKTIPDIEKAVSNIKEDLCEMLEFKPDKIILGCTHYPYLLGEMTKYAPANLFIDPAEIFVDYVRNNMTQNMMLNNSESIGYEKFFVSANPKEFVDNAKIFYNVKSLPEII